MAHSWQDASEIVAGLVLTGKYSSNCVDSHKLIAPYGDVITYLKNNPTALIEDLLSNGTFGLSVIQPALDAAHNLNGLGDSADWITILDKAYIRQNVGTQLETLGKKLQRGQEIDGLKVIEMANQLVTDKGNFTKLSNINPERVPFRKTGFPSIDYHLGGAPRQGLITIGGSPGVGKTSFLTEVAACHVHTYPKESVAIFTLEMLLGEYAQRALEINPSLSDEEKSRILINDEILTIEEISAKASTLDNLGMVGIDFADLTIRGEVTESAMGNVYKTCAALAKTMKCPVWLIAPLNRLYQGGLPRPHHLRYTSMAEYLSWLIGMLYAPSRDYFAEEKKSELPVIPGKAYFLAWKMRGGFRVHNEPGAIQLNWRGELAWSHGKGKWFSLEKRNGHDDEEDGEDDLD